MTSRASFVLGARCSFHGEALTLPNASHAARCVACHGVRSHPVPVALVGECSVPVVASREVPVVGPMPFPVVQIVAKADRRERERMLSART